MRLRSIATVEIIAAMIRRWGAFVLVVLGVAALILPSTASARRRHRAPCGTFCKNAGGLGGSPGIPPCKVLNRAIHVTGGLASVTVRCHGRHASRGAVAIYPHDFNHDYVGDGVPQGSYGGADLVCKPGQTVTLAIGLSPKTRALLHRRHSLKVDVLIELNTKPVVQANTRMNLVMSGG
jgi:hypothetical protein